MIAPGSPLLIPAGTVHMNNLLPSTPPRSLSPVPWWRCSRSAFCRKPRPWYGSRSRCRYNKILRPALTSDKEMAFSSIRFRCSHIYKASFFIAPFSENFSRSWKTLSSPVPGIACRISQGWGPIWFIKGSFPALKFSIFSPISLLRESTEKHFQITQNFSGR